MLGLEELDQLNLMKYVGVTSSSQMQRARRRTAG